MNSIVRPSFKEKFVEICTCGPHEQCTDPLKKHKRAYMAFSSQSKPNLSITSRRWRFFFLLSEKWKIVDKRLISVSFKFFVKWCDYFLTKYSWQFFYFLRRKYSWYLIQYIRFLKLSCLMCGYNLFLVLLTNDSSCKTI